MSTCPPGHLLIVTKAGSTTTRVTNTSTQRVPVILPSSFLIPESTAVKVTNTTAQKIPVILPSSFKPGAGSTAVRVTNSTSARVPVRATQDGSPWKVSSTAGVTVSNPTTAVKVTNPTTNVLTHNAFVANQTGTWGYRAGVSGTLNLSTTGKKVIGIAAHCTVAGSMTINSGDSIPIPAASAVHFNPLGTLVAPTIVFTGTDSFIVETVS